MQRSQRPSTAGHSIPSHILNTQSTDAGHAFRTSSQSRHIRTSLRLRTSAPRAMHGLWLSITLLAVMSADASGAAYDSPTSGFATQYGGRQVNSAHTLLRMPAAHSIDEGCSCSVQNTTGCSCAKLSTDLLLSKLHRSSQPGCTTELTCRCSERG